MKIAIVTAVAVLLMPCVVYAQDLEKIAKARLEGDDDVCVAMTSNEELVGVIRNRLMLIDEAAGDIDDTVNTLLSDLNYIIEHPRNVSSGASIAIRRAIDILMLLRGDLEKSRVEPIGEMEALAKNGKANVAPDLAELAKRCRQHFRDGERAFNTTSLTIARELSALTVVLKNIRDSPAE